MWLEFVADPAPAGHGPWSPLVLGAGVLLKKKKKSKEHKKE
jgi:hypothetical protein